MPFDIRLKGIQTPARLYALCRLAHYRSMTREELRDILQPLGLRKDKASHVQFDEVLYLARQGELIEDEIGIVSMQMQAEELASSDSFRRALVKRIIARPEHIFCRFTAWYLQRGASVYSENASTLMQEFDRELNQGKDKNVYSDTNITAWRTWAAFLGYGFIHSQVLVPNTFVRMSDALEEDNTLERDKILPMKKFVEWMNYKCPELDYGPISRQNMGSAQLPAQHFSMGVSAGLRALHEAGRIELSYSSDATDVWFLGRVDAHEIRDRVSLARIRRWSA